MSVGSENGIVDTSKRVVGLGRGSVGCHAYERGNEGEGLPCEDVRGGDTIITHSATPLHTSLRMHKRARVSPSLSYLDGGVAAARARHSAAQKGPPGVATGVHRRAAGKTVSRHDAYRGVRRKNDVGE